MVYQLFSGFWTLIIIILLVSVPLTIVLLHKKRYYQIVDEHATTMYLCGESEEVVFKRANYDLTSMLLNLMGLSKIKNAEINDINKALAIMIVTIALACFAVILWISLQGL